MPARLNLRLPAAAARRLSSNSTARRCFASASISMHKGAYILGASRTAVGVFNGAFTSVPAPELGATAIRSALEKANVPVDLISEVYIGQVLQGRSGQAPARQAAIGAGLPVSVEATTINKVCSSGLKAVTLAAQAIELSHSKALVAGGMENMTRVPYYLPRASQLQPFGNMNVVDGLIGDGLWDVYNKVHMGNCAENIAKNFGITRQEQDDYAIESYKRAQAAYRDGLFREEIAPVTIRGRKGETVIEEDEQYRKLNLEKVPTLKPVFDRSEKGTITAANSSPLSDGASALVVTTRDTASRFGQKSRVLSKILAYADAAVDPIDFPIAPSKAVQSALAKAGLKKDQIAIWEFNEAFATVIKANQQILGLDLTLINPRGGAIALGHALGSSGSRILTTLLHQLKDGQFGCAAICNGGGGSTAVIVQKIAYGDI